MIESNRIEYKQESTEKSLWDKIALREAVINAIVHNDYTREIPPKFEIFSDRLEITSVGSLPEGMSRNEFFEGFSIPKNKEIMRIYKDLELVEHLGSGIPRILEAYSKESFKFTANFLRMTFKSSEGIDEGGQTDEMSGKNVGNVSVKIIELMINNSYITVPSIASIIGVTERTIERKIKLLKENGKLKRIGGTRGHWEVNNEYIEALKEIS